jgi:two-component system, cell cycle sensor histidine kinase and response regulator CckA
MMEPQAEPKPKILIVEDEGPIALELSSLLKQFGYTDVGSVGSGEKALALIEKDLPDLIFMDIVLKGPMDGIETADIIRSRWELPVVFVTAFADKEWLKRAKLVHPFGYIIKPFQEKDIRITVEMALYVSKVDRERKKAEAKYRELVEDINDLLYELDDRGKIVYCSPSVELLTGYGVSELTGRVIWDFFEPEDRPEATENYQMVMAGQLRPHEYRIRIKSGEIRWIRVSSRPIREGDRVVGLRGVMTDITERKRAETALEQSEIRFRELADLLPETVFELNRDGRLTYCNQQFQVVFGYSREDLERGLFAHQMVVPEDRDRAQDALQKELNGELIKGQEYTLIKKDGTPFPVTIHSNPMIQDNKIVGLRGLVVDIRERKKLEEERLVMSKLESTGILAEGIAHDFNNLLAVILGNIELAKMIHRPGEKTTAYLEAAEKGVLTARHLTRQLIAFSKGEVPVKKPVTLSLLLQEQASFTLRGSSVECDFSFPPDLWLVEVDENQIGQCIRNIVLNGREAMPEGGRISVKAENVCLKAGTELPLQAGNYVKVTISDLGGGISEEILPRIFDPYFSTKQRGAQKGMGLGLTICHSVIKKHGGVILVTSKSAEGTSFHIFLPASRKSVQARSGPVDRLPGIGKILVMDDEEMMRTIAEGLLSQLGYQVEVAENGEKAVALYQKAMEVGCPFDGVILDLTIRGGMGGKEAIREFRKTDPEVKAIVSSGYIEDPVIDHYEQYGFKGALVKPYRISDLGEILSKVLQTDKTE